jgi:hypothetical protein
MPWAKNRGGLPSPWLLNSVTRGSAPKRPKPMTLSSSLRMPGSSMLTTWWCTVRYLSAVEPPSQAPVPSDITGTLAGSTGRVREATNGELLDTNIRPATVNPANPVRSGRLAGMEGRTGTARPGTTNQSLLRGKTVRDAARGRTLGFPTANLSQDTRGQVPAASSTRHSRPLRMRLPRVRVPRRAE